MKSHVIGNQLHISSLVLSSKPVRIEHSAILPNHQSDGLAVWVHNWQGDGDEFRVSYSFSCDINAKIYDAALPAFTEEIPLIPPRGKGWFWDFGKWVRHTKKGREQYTL